MELIAACKKTNQDQSERGSPDPIRVCFTTRVINPWSGADLLLSITVSVRISDRGRARDVAVDRDMNVDSYCLHLNEQTMTTASAVDGRGAFHCITPERLLWTNYI